MGQDQQESLLPPTTEGETPSDNDEEPEKLLRRIASALGATGVAMGAFGAHALKDTLTERGTAAMWQTATIYQLFHAVAILALATSTTPKKHLRAGKLMGVGNLLFSGSIYGLALGVGPKMILGPTTPIGGLFMIGGWVVVGFA